MTAPVPDPQELPGTEVVDQAGAKLGQVEALYAPGGEGEPMWVTIRVHTGMVGRRTVVVPLARLKEEGGTVVVPYSFQHVGAAPEIAADGEISAEDDRRLRDYYGIGRGDEPVREKNPDLYSTRVREQGASVRMEEPRGEPEGGTDGAGNQ